MQTHIWYVTAADPGMSNFYVDANPKISISILAAGAKSWIGTRKINDFEVNRTLLRIFFRHLRRAVAHAGQGRKMLNCAKC